LYYATREENMGGVGEGGVYGISGTLFLIYQLIFSRHCLSLSLLSIFFSAPHLSRSLTSKKQEITRYLEQQTNIQMLSLIA